MGIFSTATERSTQAISLIIPFYNEAESLRELLDQVLRVLGRFPKESEVILVDDGSNDGGSSIVKVLAEKDQRIKLVSFRKRLGQTAAWSAGIDYASKEIIVFSDADLQNDPSDIPMLVQKITDEGFDVVSGWRKDRKDPYFSRRLPSVIANFFISLFTGVRLHDYGCSLKAYRAELIKHVRIYGEMHRFLPAYAANEGGQVTEVVVKHHRRRHGKSKYGLSRVFRVSLDLITVKFLGGFSTKPLHAFGAVGGISFLLGLLTFSVVAYRVLILERKDATPMVFMMVIFFIASLQFIMMGLIAELATRTYHEAQSKPIYRVKELTNLKHRQRRRFL
jgi:glycosyltransferase involved in cell wall biosynthesis